MRVLITSFPGVGHFHPVAPLGDALRERGHEVRVATGEDLVPWVVDCGFDAVPAGLTEDDALTATRAVIAPGTPAGVHMFTRVAPKPMLEDLLALSRHWQPDVVLHEESEYAAPALASHLGIPCVTHSWPAPCRPDAVRREAVDAVRPLWPAASAARARVTGDLYLDACPASLQSNEIASIERVVPVRPVPFDGPPVASPGWAPSLRRPAAYVTLGTVAQFADARVLRRIVDAVQGLVVTTVVTSGPNEVSALGPLPDGVRAVRYLPQANVLPHVDLVVSHGGAGTTLGSLWHGLPHLVLSQQAPSQRLCGERIEAIGAGLHLTPEQQSRDAIEAAARLLVTDDQFRSRARTASAELAGRSGPDEVAAMVERLVERAADGAPSAARPR